jgi:hypothetical protein
MISSQANHESEASWSPHTAEHTPSSYAAWRQNLSSRYRFRDSDPVVHDSAVANVAVAYNQAGGDYVAYDDGERASAARIPAVTRSLISEDSSSAMAPMMVNIARPMGLSVST